MVSIVEDGLSTLWPVEGNYVERDTASDPWRGLSAVDGYRRWRQFGPTPG